MQPCCELSQHVAGKPLPRQRHPPVVALLSSEARMPLPRVAIYLAVAFSSSACGLAAAARTATLRRPAARPAEPRPATAWPRMQAVLCMVEICLRCAAECDAIGSCGRGAGASTPLEDRAPCSPRSLLRSPPAGSGKPIAHPKVCAPAPSVHGLPPRRRHAAARWADPRLSAVLLNVI